uniref:transmembrane protein 245-like n=1 Tax=Styela clava TaxID=7725 RepID=UPI00193A3940|nr:transmembrane protein 245-like [Styela clava]
MASLGSSRRLQRQGSVLFDSMTQLVPPGHEKPLRQAFYTAAAILFTVAGCAAAVYVYFVLEIFITPLIWAVLCGFFLFPFKYSLNSALESWLKAHEESGRPLLIGALLIPISIFDNFAENLGKFIVNRWKMLVALATILSVLYILHLIQLLYIFQLALLGIWHAIVLVWDTTSDFVEFIAEYRLILITVVGGYTVSALTLDPASVRWLGYAAVPAWISFLICLVSVAGRMQVPLGIALLVLVITGAISASKQNSDDIRRTILASTSSITAILKSVSGSSVAPEDPDSSTEDVVDAATENTQEFKSMSENDDNEASTSDARVTDIQQEKAVDELVPDRRNSAAGGSKRKRRKSINRESSSAIFFNLLFFAFVLMMAWMHTWVVVLLVLPFIYWCLKQLFYLEFVTGFCDRQCQTVFGSDLQKTKERIFAHYDDRKGLLLPPSVRSALNMIQKGDRKFNSAALQILPTITSTIMILILIVGSISISLFFAVKIQQESFLLVQMTSDLINETVSKHPEYQSWLPDNDTMHKSMDSIVDKVYSQGREWIKDQLHTSLGNEANVSLIEKQALKIWDRAYHSWFNKTIVSERKMLRRQSTENVLATSDNSSGLFSGVMDLLNMSEVIGLLKENMSALMSVMESLWSIVQTNISLVFSSVTTVVTVLLTGGTAVLNFVLSMVVFFTALFYLLAESENQYLPVKLVGFGSNSEDNPNPIGTAIQDAISGVFGASLKMASFYGLYTWLNHTALGAAMVYIPSLLAAIFSVVPVFTTYWACIPAFLELWLLQGDLLRGLILLILQFLPTMFVDGAIYSEMTESGGGHPYITGLAVAGGLYYFGLEGAIIGPILLCILLVAINTYMRIINLPATEQLTVVQGLNPQLLRQSKSDKLPEASKAIT